MQRNAYGNASCVNASTCDAVRRRTCGSARLVNRARCDAGAWNGEAGRRARVLQIALAAFSEHLLRQFSEFPASEVVCVDLTQFPAAGVFEVLRFVYAGELELTRDTVGCVWKVAEQLGVCAIIGLCEDFLGQPTVDNAIYHFAIAERFGLVDLASKLYQFIVERQEIYHNELRFVSHTSQST